ncbi:hypothetical protein B5S33_g4614 [[Candida] boidinii]|nr:hypothetical protein B5S30_g5445 [[Candida] boidinii]OWB85938.1 hypothetical protein B5S33_g4614 [[Candida] boidinii]
MNILKEINADNDVLATISSNIFNFFNNITTLTDNSHVKLKIFTSIPVTLSIFSIFYSIYKHLMNYRKPFEQRLIVRIQFLLPIFGITCYISLINYKVGEFFTPIREIYESFVIYTFYKLLVILLGGEYEIIVSNHNKPPTKHLVPFNLILRPIDVSDPNDFLTIKRCILQYVWVKPLLWIIIIFAKMIGIYDENDYSIKTSIYLWITIIYNLSVTISLYSLAIFWKCLYIELKKFNPLGKFLSIKLIIFASYWQSLFLKFLQIFNIIKDIETIKFLSNLLLCNEMVFFTIINLTSFSYTEFNDFNLPNCARMKFYYSLRDFLLIGDLIYDFKMITIYGDTYNFRNFNEYKQRDINSEIGNAIRDEIGNDSNESNEFNNLENERLLSKKNKYNEYNSFDDGYEEFVEGGGTKNNSNNNNNNKKNGSIVKNINDRKILQGFRYKDGGKSNYWLPDDHNINNTSQTDFNKSDSQRGRRLSTTTNSSYTKSISHQYLIEAYNNKLNNERTKSIDDNISFYNNRSDVNNSIGGYDGANNRSSFENSSILSSNSSVSPNRNYLNSNLTINNDIIFEPIFDDLNNNELMKDEKLYRYVKTHYIKEEKINYPVSFDYHADKIKKLKQIRDSLSFSANNSMNNNNNHNSNNSFTRNVNYNRDRLSIDSV